MPTITIGSVPNPAIICIGNAVTFTANGANLYAWSGGLSNGISFNPTSSSTYTVTGTDANNCNNTNTISLTVNPLPNVNSTPALATICFGQSMTLNGTGATTYTWSGGVLNNIPFTINNSTTYTVTGTDANGRSNTNTKLVTVNPLPTISVLPSNPAICLNQSVNLTAGGGSSYVWSPATGLNQTTGATVSASPTGSTSYTITGTSVNGCSNTISNTVTINPLPALSATPSSATICIGDSVTLNMNGANTYSWFPTAGLNQSTGPQVKASPNTTTTYTITGTNANGCTNTKVVTVTVNPSYNRYDTLDLCQGMSYTFGSQTITTSGNYINTYQSGLSCDSTVNLHVKVYDKPVSNFSLDEHACANESIQIQSNWQSPQASYLWDVGDGILSGNTQVVNVVWTIPGTKIVSLEVATQSPCMPEKFIDTIEVHQPQANIKVSDADTFFCIYDQVKLQTPNLNGYSYLWSPATYFNSKSYIAEGVVKEPVSVKVNVKDQWGCEAEDSKYLNVQPCCNAYLPNSFTPNGDGLNDIFRIIGEGNYHVLDFYVANRWGNIVFRTINQNEGWDGKIQGIEQSTDTYYYFLNYECSNGQKRFIKGDLLLLR
ncbi:MAG: gliding motility-associated C-terminal domain-containing protein [Bacteroidetes bacterium]|nr:gliding motility-associated C-terminal domain-containing protein [Bacteroidota bacterium]